MDVYVYANYDKKCKRFGYRVGDLYEVVNSKWADSEEDAECLAILCALEVAKRQSDSRESIRLSIPYGFKHHWLLKGSDEGREERREVWRLIHKQINGVVDHYNVEIIQEPPNNELVRYVSSSYYLDSRAKSETPELEINVKSHQLVNDDYYVFLKIVYLRYVVGDLRILIGDFSSKGLLALELISDNGLLNETIQFGIGKIFEFQLNRLPGTIYYDGSTKELLGIKGKVYSASKRRGRSKQEKFLWNFMKKESNGPKYSDSFTVEHDNAFTTVKVVIDRGTKNSSLHARYYCSRTFHTKTLVVKTKNLITKTETDMHLVFDMIQELRKVKMDITTWEVRDNKLRNAIIRSIGFYRIEKKLIKRKLASIDVLIGRHIRRCSIGECEGSDMVKENPYTLFVDGSYHAQGIGGAGIVLYKQNKNSPIIVYRRGVLYTNLQDSMDAEFRALLSALRYLEHNERYKDVGIKIFCDCETVGNLIKAPIGNNKYKEELEEVAYILAQNPSWEVVVVKRKKVAPAHTLAYNAGIKMRDQFEKKAPLESVKIHLLPVPHGSV